MDKKDLLGLELKSLMEEDTRNLALSQETIDKILTESNPRPGKTGWVDRIRAFLNKEVEVPLAPALVGLVAFLLFTSIPKDLLGYESKEVIEIGSNQVIISSREVGQK